MFGEVLVAGDLVGAVDRVAVNVLGGVFFVGANVGQHFDGSIGERALTTELGTQLRVRELSHRQSVSRSSLCASDQCRGNSAVGTN